MRFAAIDFFVAIVPTLQALFQMELKQRKDAGARIVGDCRIDGLLTDTVETNQIDLFS